ncbi:hypothetical protein [Natranaerobius trueperi]|uniref:Uncharacterized protein n=1 Tax=Natranaerobius trueperi TaxID=759412 RepID=A0A226BWL7_9FIRM|nr:hypothetical protein [Natranaerobius trueperi]OWZ83355.1 hypothetical protein CDO51_09045 [Natranaerobius trueperi]
MDIKKMKQEIKDHFPNLTSKEVEENLKTAGIDEVEQTERLNSSEVVEVQYHTEQYKYSFNYDDEFEYLSYEISGVA